MRGMIARPVHTGPIGGDYTAIPFDHNERGNGRQLQGAVLDGSESEVAFIGVDLLFCYHGRRLALKAPIA